MNQNDRRSRVSINRRICLGAVVTVIALFSGVATAFAGASLSVVPTVPMNSTVGSNGVPASLALTNTSFSGPGETGFETDSFQVTALTLVPSCGSSLAGADCPAGSRDPGVLVPNPLTGTGRAGTACAGRTFTFTLTDPLQGKYSLTPDMTVVLGPASGALAVRRCIVDYSVRVDKGPTFDSAATPDSQTDQKAFASISDITPGVNLGQTGSGIGTAQMTILLATPSISGQATPGASLGGPISDQATISGGSSPTGTITFTAYGPADVSCSAPAVYTSNPIAVAGAGSYSSAPAFAPTTAGTYRWRASYSGDVNNVPVQTPCNAANQSSVIQQATPSISGQATPAASLGGPISDQATISGGSSPTGTITFTAYGPADASCSAPAVYTSNLIAVAGAGSYSSAPAFAPTTAGTYRWRASYSGDVNNAPVQTPCNAANQSSVVTAPPAPTPVSQITAPAVTLPTVLPTQPKKCKKGRKLKRGKCVRKKKK